MPTNRDIDAAMITALQELMHKKRISHKTPLPEVVAMLKNIVGTPYDWRPSLVNASAVLVAVDYQSGRYD